MAKTKINNDLLIFEAPVSALARWNPEIQAAEKASTTVFNIYGYIGASWDGNGVTPEMLATFLADAGNKNIVVNVNSAGGNFFDGLAMHTMLSEYEGNVHVKIVGLAASAASMLAMAGDEISIAESALVMVHNAWSCACGNSADMSEASRILDKLDVSMAKLYTSKTGLAAEEVRLMMAEETWLDGAEAIAKGFAHKMLGEKDVVESKDASTYNAALRQVDVTLAKAGMPRSNRRDLLKKISSATPRAGDPKENVTPRADKDEKEIQKAALGALLKSIKS